MSQEAGRLIRPGSSKPPSHARISSAYNRPIESAMSLTIIPDFVVAIFAAWLGVSVLVRTPRDRVARIFGLVTGLVAVWSSSWLVRRLESDADVQLVAGGVTAVAGTLLPAALLHLVGRFSSSQEEWRSRRLLVWGAYVACGLVGLRAAS